jgi:hypothetical protein
LVWGRGEIARLRAAQQVEASMSSESGEKPEPEQAVFASAHANARAASAWGSARTAVAAVHNLESLLRRSYVPGPVILDLLPELKGGATVLRDAFELSQQGDPAAHAVGEYGARRVAELDALLEAVPPLSAARDESARQAGVLADSLEGSVDLLALLDRAVAPLVTEVRLDLLAQEAGRMSGTARGRELLVWFDPAPPHCVLSTDPTLLVAMVSLLVASVHASANHAPLVLRARSSPRAELVVEPRQGVDGALSTLAIRVMAWIEPSEAVARRIALDLGASLDLRPGYASLTLACARE